MGREIGINVPLSQFLAWVRAEPEKRAATAVAWLLIAERHTNGVLSTSDPCGALYQDITRVIIATMKPTLRDRQLSGNCECALNGGNEDLDETALAVGALEALSAFHFDRGFGG